MRLFERFNALLLLLGASLWAQGTRGTITGIIKDPSGAVIPNVTVTVINEQTGARVIVQSLADGVYRAPQLLPGNYTVSAEHAGFRKVNISGLKLDVAGTLTQDLLLEVGAVTETMKVSGQSSLVETTSAEVSTTVALDHVLEMPLVDRNVFSLINLTPGGYFVSTTQSRAYISGSRGWETGSSVDGVYNMRGGLGTQNMELLPPVDSMQEFKVQASNYSSEFGRSQGATVTSATKSGTNVLHGAFYEFLRNDKLDARGWAADAKPPLRRSNFGANIGGPVIRNRTFFFFSFDGLRERQGASITRDVGLPEWRKGDFSKATRQVGTSAVVVPVYDPETGAGTFTNPLGTTPFPGNVIPSSRLDPVAVKAAAYIPNPNRAPDNPYTQAGNWQLNRVNTNTRDYYIGRADHEVSQKTRMFFRTIFTKPEVTKTPEMKGWGPADPNTQSVRWGHQNHGLNVTHLLSSTFFLTFTAGFNRTKIPTYSAGCCDGNFAEALGIANAMVTDGFPALNYTGGTVPVTAIGAQNAYREVDFNTTDVMANFTKASGNHTLKFGGNHTSYGGNLTRRTSVANYAFDGRFTRGTTATGAAVVNTGVNLADFLLGRLTSIAATLQPMIGKRIKHYAGYFQDDWRVTGNLTLNVGARYETETPIYEVANRMANFLPYAPNPLAGKGDIPAGAVGIMMFAGRNGFGKYLSRWDKNNLAPRFGFAYRLRGSSNSSIRGGYGIYYGNPTADAAVGFGLEAFSQDFSLQHPISFRLRDGLPKGALDFMPESELTPTWGNRGTRFERSAITMLDPARVFPYSQSFNLTLQHQWKGILFEAGYRGNLGRHIQMGDVNLNRIFPDMLSRTEIPARLRRPWTVFTSDQAAINVAQPNWGISNYHAFTFKSERRFANGTGWIVAYTHSKQIDNCSFIGGTQLGDNDALQNYWNFRGEKSLSTGSLAHRLVFSPIVDLPFGKGRKWINRGGALNAVLGGWQISTIGTIQSGFPFGVTILNGPRDILGDSTTGTALRPNLLLDPKSANQGQPAQGVRGLQWLEPSAFANPPRYTFGNAARTLPGVAGPGTVSFDSMLAKNFGFADRWRAQFRWEMFNAFNTPQFGQPAQNLGGPNFGLVTGASGRRIMQFGLKLYW